MIFETLWESAQRNELLLVDDGLCHFHLRRDGQLTIREIIVLPRSHKRGIGSHLLRRLMHTQGATSIFARCPADLPANDWYKAQGFICEGQETSKKGRKLNLWRLKLSTAGAATLPSIK